MALSPMMKQYMEIKEQNKDNILFFRLGDFYEMFFDDAITVSKELELTLTGKNCGLEERAPMCGVPFHSADTYIARLINKGYKVAICEQTEDPATTKGLVKREVIKVVTPGTLTSSAMLHENENNYLASVHLASDGAGIAYCDISTGEIYATQIDAPGIEETLLNELVKIDASEIIANEYAQSFFEEDDVAFVINSLEQFFPENYCSADAAEKNILSQFNILSLKGLGIDEKLYAVRSLGMLLSYLRETQMGSLEQIQTLNVYQVDSHMVLDKSTIRNLELTETLYEKNIKGSLLGVLDKTNTAMGGRLMKRWIKEPLNTTAEINLRLDAVEALTEEFLILNDVRENLKHIYDFHRLAGRIASGNANGKDMIALASSISAIPPLKDDLTDLTEHAKESCPTDPADLKSDPIDNRNHRPLLAQLNDEIDALEPVLDMIERAITDDPPFTIKEGGVIRHGFSQELDDLKDSIADAQTWIAELEGKERERTGIKNLKVGFNKVFGYYLEVTKSAYDLVPEEYIRKQTLVNAERFITPELKEMESLVLNAETKINKLEYELFTQLRNDIKSYIGTIQQTSAAIAVLDVLASFAKVSLDNDYRRPKVNDGRSIQIISGRHPVIEQMIKDGVFVSNDVYMNDTDASMLLITGPNMAGKSTYMRQTAILVLMAQAGCFIPCASADIGVVDRIFTRIGASDNLAQGQSTFFVEMSELAYILNSATEKSLVILDEIGRGTSTYDGLSIAWAAVEHLCSGTHRIRTMFATHYHELTVLEDMLPGVRNMNVDVTTDGGNIIFLHKIVEGSASRSYGIHVARLAGVPKSLLERADEKLQELESGSTDNRIALSGQKNVKTVSDKLPDGEYDSELYTNAADRIGEITDQTPDAGTGNRADVIQYDGTAVSASSYEEQEAEIGSQVSAKDTEDEFQINMFDFAPNPVLDKIRELDLMETTPSQALRLLEELKKSL